MPADTGAMLIMGKVSFVDCLRNNSLSTTSEHRDSLILLVLGVEALRFVIVSVVIVPTYVNMDAVVLQHKEKRKKKES